MRRAGGDNHRVVIDCAVAEYHAAFRGIYVHGLGEQHFRVFLPPQNLPQRRSDVGRRQRSRRDLIQQRLKKMVIAAVDQGDVHRGVLERARDAEAAESSPDDDNFVTIRHV